MLFSRAGKNLLRRVKKLLVRSKTTVSVKSRISDFFFGGYRRLPRSAAAMDNSNHAEENFEKQQQEQFQLQEEEQEQEQEQEQESCAAGSSLLVVGSFLNFGNIKNGRPVPVSVSFSASDSFAEAALESKNKEKLDNNNAGGSKSSEAMKEEEEDTSGGFAESRAEACLMFENKLKEMVSQHDDPRDWMDIHEFLYYYSRLTCPFYIDMVNRFFHDVCGS